MVPKFIDKAKLVHKPGVYLYFDNRRNVIYVGKAIDLNKRISSYFRINNLDVKTTNLVSRIAAVETIVVESELEALILEANLIKKYLPQFNVRLTDDKDYLYIKVTKADYPQIKTARSKDLADALDYFGPFPSSTVVKKTLKSLRRIFPWCSGRLTAYGLRRAASTKDSSVGQLAVGGRRRACFYYHLGLCPGACVGAISKEDYNKIISRFRRFLDGQKQGLVEDLAKEMDNYSKNLDFERAQQIKNIISGVNYMTQSNRVSLYLDDPNFLDNQRIMALEELQKELRLSAIPSRIECYDISNFQGHQASGSMVVLTDGEIDKSQYRRFNIKISGRPNDYAMHSEMMSRRLKHPEWPLPDLFLIDGGLGQVRAAADQLQKHNISRPVFGLAKRMEWLYPPDGEILKLPRRSLGLRLLQKIRDESHRFAITYHRKLRARAFGLVKV